MRIRTATITRLRDALLKSGRRPSTVSSSAYETLTRAGMLSGDETAALNRVEPLAEVMFLVMSADGAVAQAEQDAIRGAIRGLTGDLLHEGTINVMLETFRGRLEEEGREQRLEAITKRLASDASDAEGGFALAAAIALADDEVSEHENAFIEQLAGWLGIEAARAREILDQLDQDKDSDPFV